MFNFTVIIQIILKLNFIKNDITYYYNIIAQIVFLLQVMLIS